MSKFVEFNIVDTVSGPQQRVIESGCVRLLLNGRAYLEINANGDRIRVSGSDFIGIRPICANVVEVELRK
jgi:hypothetical protein